MDGTGDSNTLVLIELVLVLGVVFWFAWRELRGLKRDTPRPGASPAPAEPAPERPRRRS
ncbi:hypothetical protein [Rhodoplanes elegans]|uniref:hypothetical protein n=1 Tax=Rhodoplanes elegans TaxID=29408 RepID=UPI00147639F1|nr:hypothetical protein [Rhodoplanes elegans]